MNWLLPFALAPSSAWAADAWNANCASKDDPTVWFVFAAPPPAKDAPPVAPPDFDCKGLFFGTVPCPSAVGMGKIRVSGTTPGGQPTYELRYLPYGDVTTILVFLEKDERGVTYAPPAVAAASPAATLPPPPPTELMRGYLQQRHRASAPTQGVAMHLWMCPEASFAPPDDAITPYGMTVVPHAARAPL